MMSLIRIASSAIVHLLIVFQSAAHQFPFKETKAAFPASFSSDFESQDERPSFFGQRKEVQTRGILDFENETVLKTGTTIVGLVFRDGVVLGADTRSTGGPLVMDKNVLKIHTIAPRIFSCAAGTSADCSQITRAAGHQLALLRIERELAGEMRSLDPVPAAISSIVRSLHNTVNPQRKPSSVLIVGGYDDNGPSLHLIDGDGVPQRVTFGALGSGSTDAIAMLESLRESYKTEMRRRREKNQRIQTHTQSNDNNSDKRESTSSISSEAGNSNVAPPVRPSSTIIERRGTSKTCISGGREGQRHSVQVQQRYMEDVDVETAIDWVRQSVRAGILNDLGSGSHVDLCVIKLDEVRRWREKLQSSWDSDRLDVSSHRGLLVSQQQQQQQQKESTSYVDSGGSSRPPIGNHREGRDNDSVTSTNDTGRGTDTDSSKSPAGTLTRYHGEVPDVRSIGSELLPVAKGGAAVSVSAAEAAAAAPSVVSDQELSQRRRKKLFLGSRVFTRSTREKYLQHVAVKTSKEKKNTKRRDDSNDDNDINVTGRNKEEEEEDIQEVEEKEGESRLYSYEVVERVVQPLQRYCDIEMLR